MVWSVGLPTQDGYDFVARGFKITFAFRACHVGATAKRDAITDSQEKRRSSQDVVGPLG